MTRPGKPARAPRLTIAVLAVSFVLSTSPALSTQLPNVMASNEAEAIATLRLIAATQSVFKRALDIDTNCDGVGEYGYFAELAGTQPMRVASGGTPGPCWPAAGAWGVDMLVPPLIRNEFGVVVASSVVHRGYVFQMWLPDAVVGGAVWAHAEDWFGGKLAAPFPDPSTSAKYWCCYAWPLAYGQTGRRAFFINQRGQVLRYSNRSVTPFTGLLNTPYFDEAFLVPQDMSSPIRVWIPGGSAGSIWSLVP